MIAARPPAVVWRIGPTRAHRLLCRLCLLGGALALGSFVALQPWGWRSLVQLLLFGACVGIAQYGLRRDCHGSLSWDGERWHRVGFDGAVISHVQCALDFQRWMLLRIRTVSGKNGWLWAESDGMSARWMAFRRAVCWAKAEAVQRPVG